MLCACLKSTRNFCNRRCMITLNHFDTSLHKQILTKELGISRGKGKCLLARNTSNVSL